MDPITAPLRLRLWHDVNAACVDAALRTGVAADVTLAVEEIVLWSDASTAEAARDAVLGHLLCGLHALRELAARNFGTAHLSVELAHDDDPSEDERAWLDDVLRPALRDGDFQMADRLSHLRAHARSEHTAQLGGLLFSILATDARGAQHTLLEGGAQRSDTGRHVSTRILRAPLLDALAPPEGPARLDEGTELRRAEHHDAERLARILVQPSVRARFPALDPAHDADALAAWLVDPDVEVHAIVRNGEVVGALELRESEQGAGHPVAEVALFVDENMRGRGVAERALLALCDELRTRDHHRVLATLLRDDVAARRVLSRCGFRLVGTLRDLARMGDDLFADGVLLERVLVE